MGKRLSNSEAAQYLGCSENMLNRLRIRGEGPPFNKKMGHVIYDSDDLDKWFEEGKQRSTVDSPARRIVRRSNKRPKRPNETKAAAT